MSKRYETELIKVLDKLPEEKAIELIDFGKFLLSQYPYTSKSQIDESSLLLQQKSLSKIWDDPEENVYDLWSWWCCNFANVILLGITSQRIDNINQTEFLIKEGTDEFIQSGLAKTSVLRCEYVMTVPKEIISRKLGKLSDETMNKIDPILKLSLGLQ